MCWTATSTVIPPREMVCPGGTFVAQISTFHNVVLPFVPIADGYVPPPAGIDPPAGFGSRRQDPQARR